MDEAARFLLAHRDWAGPAFGLLAYGESLAVVGTIIPATPILFLVGTLLGDGTLDPWAVLPWAMAGAIGGYWTSWGIGRRIGPRVYAARALAGRRRGIARVRLFVRRWGGLALIVGRFVLGPLQSLLPLAAGVAGMGARRFHAWNVASGLLWVLVVLTPGWLAGRGLRVTGAPGWARDALLAVLAAASLLALLAVPFALRRRG